jgi:hypothetical protein
MSDQVGAGGAPLLDPEPLPLLLELDPVPELLPELLLDEPELLLLLVLLPPPLPELLPLEPLEDPPLAPELLALPPLDDETPPEDEPLPLPWSPAPELPSLGLTVDAVPP